MKFITILPFEYDDNDVLEMELFKIIELEIIYLNIDQIKTISPIGETGHTKINLLDNTEILSIEPLYKILEKINKV